MRVLILSTYDFDGGASRAAYRLHCALTDLAVESHMLVYNKFTYDHSVIGPKNRFELGLNLIRPHLDQLPLRLYPGRERSTWSTSLFPNGIEKKIARLDPDLIHIHWAGFGFLPIGSLARLRKPVVWTLHDMWPFTGGCHYAGACTGYVGRCGHCPQLGSRSVHDLSRWIMAKKRTHWRMKEIVVVSPSRWLADCARSSSLFSQSRIEVIPNPIDLKVYKTIDKAVARDLLNLPREGKIVLFVAINARQEPRKGYAKLSACLESLVQVYPSRDLTMLVAGTGSPEEPEMPCRAHYLGRLHDDFSMVLAYSAADVFVAPSLQENLPNTIMEAMACGTPCVAFDIGGIPDIVGHRVDGYLARPFDAADLAKGVAWMLESGERRVQMGENARTKIESFGARDMVVEKHLDLYREILSRTQTNGNESTENNR